MRWPRPSRPRDCGCARTPSRTSAARSPGRRSRAARSASAARRPTRRSRSSMRESPTCSSPTRSSRPRSLRALPRRRAARASGSSSTARRACGPRARRRRDAGVTLDLYVEVDVGAHRCGVAPADAGPLAACIASLPGVRFAGLHCYHGAAQHLRAPAEREAAIVVRDGGRARGEGVRRARRARRRHRHGRGDRHVDARARLGRVERAAARLVSVHGCRLRTQRSRGHGTSHSSRACSCTLP